MAYSHCTGPGTGQGTGQGTGKDGFLYYAVYCTHYTGKGREPLFPIVCIPVPVPDPDLFPVPCSVYEPLGCIYTGRDRDLG